MAKAFADITFTPAVKAVQERFGSRGLNSSFEEADDPANTIGPFEAAFIKECDSFYLATVNEKGWPYVQHRGGPRGFLKVLDERTIGYADFRGNRQYLSAGNISADERVSLILMDYPNRRRLKLWGRARMLHADIDTRLLTQLEMTDYRARVEWGLLIFIEAVEWNCPQHITPRYTEEELAHRLLRQGSSMQAQAPRPRVGNGPLQLRVSGIRRLTPRIRSYELHSVSGEDLPLVTAGSHLQVPVVLANGTVARRSYSICSDPGRRDLYEIAVLLREDGGGSKAFHEQTGLDCELHCGLPVNHFPLHDDKRPAVLIAGGIGITPLRAMAYRLKEQQRDFHLHYAGRSRSEMAFLAELQSELGERLSNYCSDEQNRIDPARLMASAIDDAVFYVCGPGSLIDEVRARGLAAGIPAENIRSEYFSSATDNTGNQPVELILQRSGKIVSAGPDESLLDAMLAAGIDAPYSCRTGECGTCAVKVLDGETDHRDDVLTTEEREERNLMCPCVSRSLTGSLTLDI